MEALCGVFDTQAAQPPDRLWCLWIFSTFQVCNQIRAQSFVFNGSQHFCELADVVRLFPPAERLRPCLRRFAFGLAQGNREPGRKETKAPVFPVEELTCFFHRWSVGRRGRTPPGWGAVVFPAASRRGQGPWRLASIAANH